MGMQVFIKQFCLHISTFEILKMKCKRKSSFLVNSSQVEDFLAQLSLKEKYNAYLLIIIILLLASP